MNKPQPEYNHQSKMLKYGIPKGYCVELIITNFIIKSGDKTVLIPVFPNEIIPDCDYGIREVIETDVKVLQEITETYEVIGKLHYLGLIDIAEDLREAEIRLEKGDIDGSIKFFRKTVEGLKKFVSKNKSILESANRADALKDYITKSYHLLSNFGEHTGTEALTAEAHLSKTITVSIAKYIVEKMEE
ncbi:MAG: hypothetical protein J7K13_00255 [Thermoplasmata archaeon]|nr:hypothetical protein [Thermoplasmata archaeon]